MAFRNEWITVWSIVGVLDSSSLQVIGPVLAFVVGALGLFVNYHISARNNATQIQLEKQRSEDLVRQIELVNRNVELARITAIDEAARVRDKLEVAKAELDESMKRNDEVTEQHRATIEGKVDSAAQAAKKAYVEANDANKKLAQVTALVMVQQDQTGTTVQDATKSRIANTAAIEHNTEATERNSELRDGHDPTEDTK